MFRKHWMLLSCHVLYFVPVAREKIFRDNFVHVYNRGVDKRDIFLNDDDRDRFLQTLKFCNTYRYPYSKYLERISKPNMSFKPKDMELFHRSILLDIAHCDVYAYVLMPNHFHLLLKQNTDNGVSKLLQKLSNSYTKHFNEKYTRTGSLFGGKFKYRFVFEDYNLRNVMQYVHLNPVRSKLVHKGNLRDFKWSSLHELSRTAYGIVPEKLKPLLRESYVNLKAISDVSETLDVAFEEW